MNIQTFLEHHGIVRNPFAEEDAQTDQVFKEYCISSAYHPIWDKVYGDPSEPSTAMIFGPKGSGKTAIRLQIDRHLQQYNKENPSKRVFIIRYDDFNPFLDHFCERMSRRTTRKPEKVLDAWKLWDHMDAILCLGVTKLVDEILHSGKTGPTSSIDRPALKNLDRSAARDMMLLACCYDQSIDSSFNSRWNLLRKKVRYRNGAAKRSRLFAMMWTLLVVAFFAFLFLRPGLTVATPTDLEARNGSAEVRLVVLMQESNTSDEESVKAEATEANTDTPATESKPKSDETEPDAEAADTKQDDAEPADASEPNATEPDAIESKQAEAETPVKDAEKPKTAPAPAEVSLADVVDAPAVDEPLAAGDEVDQVTVAAASTPVAAKHSKGGGFLSWFNSVFGNQRPSLEWLWLAPLLILLGALPYLVRQIQCHLLARGIHKHMRVGKREIGSVRRVLSQISAKEMASQPLPRFERTDDRYELLHKFQSVLDQLGFAGTIVLMDRVDEPHMTGGKPELMRRFVWPMLDNKLLKHPGLGFKMMLPQELHRDMERESREFHERARLDKQNVIPAFQWTGESLYDLARARMMACAAEGKSPEPKDLFDDEVDYQRLLSAFQALRVPRHLFRFLYRVLVDHCNRYTDSNPEFQIKAETFETVHAVYMRESDPAVN